MLQFTIFGIPVRVQPWFWIVPFFVSGAMHMDADQAMLQKLIIWTATIFLSILVHELGHALTGRKLGGGHAAIELNAFGGLAFNQGGRFTPSARRWMIAMGPGAGFLLAGLTFLAMCLVYGLNDAGNLFQYAVFRNTDLRWDNLSSILERRGLFELFLSLTRINVWWGILNLAPIMPLDGGQLYDSFAKSPRRTHLVGLITGGLLATWGFTSGHLFLTILMGYLAYQNYQAMQQSRY